jgi:diguanylate cyclase (GGDEF)-like protein
MADDSGTMRHSDHYADVDLLLVTRLGGVLWLVGAVAVMGLAPLEPPTALLGDAGWAVLGACVAGAVLTGAVLVRRTAALRPTALLAHAVAALVVVALLCVLTPPAHPFSELAFLVVVQTAMIHPARRVALVLLVACASLTVPVLVVGLTAAHAVEVAGHLVLLNALAGVSLVWASRMRALRRELREQRREAVELARVDALTGLGNRRALDEALAVQRSVTARTGRPLSLLLCDLDDFKAVNDEGGHGQGDAALRCVADVLRDTLRQPDHVFRWGGDEFVALLPDTPAADATGVAARVRRALPARCVRPDGTRQHVSVGVAELRPGESGADLLERADGVLLAAKAQARGRRLA